ncbi:MAG TPA: hypothetical protein H9713_07930 [Candidatus Mediterraneibacter surreyensis]|nr:hypothetical protein [Candidatus Mediterraneibacter surreyensis]HJD25431.1 hypothetical protein [Candidatus Blautia intestinipullorum]
MKNFVIRFVKNNPILYRGAKKVYRTFQPAKPTIYRNNDYSIVYRLDDPDEMKNIIAHYNDLRRENTKIVVLVSGNELKLHNLIRMYPGVIFLSTDYYRRYQKKLTVRNMILTDWHQPASDIIDLL